MCQLGLIGTPAARSSLNVPRDVPRLPTWRGGVTTFCPKIVDYATLLVSSKLSTIVSASSLLRLQALPACHTWTWTSTCKSSLPTRRAAERDRMPWLTPQPPATPQQYALLKTSFASSSFLPSGQTLINLGGKSGVKSVQGLIRSSEILVILRFLD